MSEAEIGHGWIRTGADKLSSGELGDADYAIEEAKKHFLLERAVNPETKNIAYYHQLKAFYFRKVGQLDDAIKDFEESIKIWGIEKDFYRSEIALSLKGMALCYLRDFQLGLALSYFLMAMQHDRVALP